MSRARWDYFVVLGSFDILPINLNTYFCS
jgi:hypothetical protein